jgi:hypothetical protein
MPLFFFDVHDGSGKVLRDDEGLPFPDMANACHQALKTLCEMGRDLYAKGPQEMTIVVREAETGMRLRVTLSLGVDREQ